jgi:putative nucleotidyltransferase with HDIG domain
VKPLRWFVNVVPRTVRAFVPALARPDDAFARAALPPRELALYLAMDARDRHHGVRVARSLLERDPEADDVLVRAALLHDVGKSVAPYRAWERIAVHLYALAGARGLGGVPARGGRALRAPPRGLRDAWTRHARHAETGAALLRRAGAHEVAALVARHHDPDPDPRLALLRAADEAT